MKNFRDMLGRRTNQTGFSLMEVLIGIAIFAIGMLALASLQGALTRSTAEAKVRTTAINIAEQIIEGQRGFAQVSGTGFTYDSITDVTTPIIFDGKMTRNPASGSEVGVIYSVTQDVTDYYYDLASDAFTTTAPTGAVTSDYKTIVVNVTWNDNRDFVIDESTTAGNLGGGAVSVSATISNVSVVTAAQVTGQDENDIIAPTILYTPGDNPDIVSLGLGDDKFKESLTPEPKVYRDNLETRFDVVTYSNPGSGAFFLRREEFVAVSCDCTLNAASENNQGKTPAVWAGDEYTEPVLVTKPYGTQARNVAQSPLCETCCRDHHDIAGYPLYDPSRPTSEYSGGNHKHYSRFQGGFQVAGVGDDYIEACRFVRKDGFFRLTQDFRLEGLNTFQGDYLITDAQVTDYSNYVIKEVYYTGDDGTADPTGYVPDAIAAGDGYQLAESPPTVESAPRTASGDTAADTDLTAGFTYLPTAVGADFQQLRSRSIYVDNLSSDLRAVIACLETKTESERLADPGICDQGDVELDRTGSTNILELIPFFEVQTTYLNDWQKEVEGSNEFTLTNETVSTSDANGPTHSRGLVTNQPTSGFDWVNTIVNRGVTGVTSTDPINALDTDGDPSNGINNVLPQGAGWPPGDIEVITGADSPSFDGRVIMGTLSSEVNGLKAANVGITATEAICNYATTTGVFTCFIPTGADAPVLTVSGFDKPPKTIYLCSSHQFIGTPAELPVDSPASFRDPKDVDLSNALEAPVEPYSLWLTEDACPVDNEPI